MTYPFEELQAKCRALRLAETAKELPDLLRTAEAKGWTYHELIHELLSYELRCREIKQQERCNRQVKLNNFPQIILNSFLQLRFNSLLFKNCLSIFHSNTIRLTIEHQDFTTMK
jgi:DNA replication protein DnaC